MFIVYLLLIFFTVSTYYTALVFHNQIRQNTDLSRDFKPPMSNCRTFLEPWQPCKTDDL